MKKTNTYIANGCNKKVDIFVDKNGHYTIKKYVMQHGIGWFKEKERTYKHFHTAERACKKWVNN